MVYSKFSVRIPQDVREALEAYAASEDRSLTYIVEKIIKAHLEKAPGAARAVARSRASPSAKPKKRQKAALN